MDEKPPLGEQQLAVLNFVVEHAPISRNEVARRFGAPRGLARTTICTVMETLRTKGYLVRAKKNGVDHYSPTDSKAALHDGLVERFVDKALGGSIFPLIAYLSRQETLSPEEIAALRSRLDELESAGEETGE